MSFINQHLFDDIYDDIDSFTNSPDQNIYIYGCIREWENTKNPTYIDLMLIYINHHKLNPSIKIFSIVAEAASARINETTRADGVKKVLNKIILQDAVNLMCNLMHGAGISKLDAASRAAQYIKDKYNGKTYKASTLEKEYKTHMPNIEENIKKKILLEKKQMWLDALPFYPLADDELKGERR